MFALAPPAVASAAGARSRVLIVGPSSSDSSKVREALENCRLGGTDVTCVPSVDDACQQVHEDVAAILLDLHSADALNIAAQLREQLPRVRVILFYSRPDHLICLEVLAPPDGSDCECASGSQATAALSDRQLEILRHLASGLSVKEIARTMRMSYKSIDSLKYRLMRRLAIHDRVGLTLYAIREGLIAP